MVKVNLLFFGSLSEKAGTSKMEIKGLDELLGLKVWLEMEYPFLEEMPYLVAVNQTVVKGNARLADGDEVAVMPPFAGG